MIDEKKLIEEIEEYTLSVYGCDINDIVAFQTNNESESAYIVQGICEAIDFIKQQEKVGEWIPISERLPEIRKDCLVTAKYTGFMGMYGSWVQTGHLEDDGKWWGSCMNGEVIAW